MSYATSGSFPARRPLRTNAIRAALTLPLLAAVAAAFGAAPTRASAEGGKITIATGPKDRPAKAELVPGSGASFTDCSAQLKCPLMTVVPDASDGFLAGSPETEVGHRDTEMQHRVTIKAFAVGITEVSVEEYLECVKAGGCREPEWREPGGQHNIETGSTYYRALGAAVTGPRQPVVGVSYDDAVAYANWLAQVTGQRYRLPSETEWEYAARAGTKTAYWWGDEVVAGGKVHAACRGCGSNYDGQSLAPVDSFDANPWGLYNVHGNVWEWVADFYCGAYEKGPADGAPRLADDCEKRDGKGLRVFRGGSAYYEPDLMRSALRLRNYADFRNISVGFRIARDITPE